MPKTTSSTNTEAPADKKTPAASKNSKSLIAKSTSVEITLKWNEVAPVYKKSLSKLGRDVKAEGFRVGKAPAAIIEAKVGFERIADQVLQELLPGAYEATIKASGHQPITTPEFNPVKIAKNADWVLQALFDLMPQVKLGNWKKVVKQGQKTATAFISKRNQEIAQEAKECKTDDKNHDHAHAHQPLTEAEEREIRLQHIFKALVEHAAPAVGEIMLRQETQNEYERLLKQLKQYGMTAEDYLKRREINIEQLSQELAASVLSRLQIDFILAAISQETKIELSEQETEAELNKITNLKMREELRNNRNYLNQLKANLLQQKTLDLLLQV